MTNWHIEGQYMETCNCAYICPCIGSNLAALPTEGDCKAAIAMKIDTGEKDGVSLDGLALVVLLYSPGAMADGNFKVGLIIDENADEAQTAALGEIVSGAAGGPMEALGPLVADGLRPGLVPHEVGIRCGYVQQPQLRGERRRERLGDCQDSGGHFREVDRREDTLHVFSLLDDARRSPRSDVQCLARDPPCLERILSPRSIGSTPWPVDRAHEAGSCGKSPQRCSACPRGGIAFDKRLAVSIATGVPDHSAAAAWRKNPGRQGGAAMGEIRERIENEMKGLRTIRDDLRVRLHLGQREVRDQWEKLERTWQHVEAKTKVLREESKESMEDVEEAARLLVDEIREGYRNLKRLV